MTILFFDINKEKMILKIVNLIPSLVLYVPAQ